MGKAARAIMITREDLEWVAKTAAEVATETAMSTYRKQKAQEEREKFDRRLNNVKLLLRNYREFSEYTDNAIYKLYEKLDEDLIDVIELMDGRRPDEDGEIESIAKGVIRTKTIMSHVNTMLEVYRGRCEKSPYPEEKRRYQVVYRMYLKPEAETVEAIAEELGVNERTVYKDLTVACKRLTALIFGIDGFDRNR